MILSGVIFGITIFLLLFLLSMIWPPDSPWSPWWRTNGKVAKAMIRLAGITKDDLIYDLGCGDGTVLLTAATLRRASGVGIEIDPSRVIIARLRVLLAGVRCLIQIKRGDLFSQDVSDATVVVVYLVPKTLKRLEKKFMTELRPGTRVISYVYPISYLPLIKEDDELKINIYKIPNRANKKKYL